MQTSGNRLRFVDLKAVTSLHPGACRRTAMFEPRISKATTNAGTGSNSRTGAPLRDTHATPRLDFQAAQNVNRSAGMDLPATHGTSWDLTRVSVFAPNRVYQHQAQSPSRAASCRVGRN